MKVVVVYALIVFAAILIFIPFSRAKQCLKIDSCFTKKFNATFPDREHVKNVECDECASWYCLRNGVAYSGYGCKGDGNICNDGKNQDGDSYFDDKENCYYAHKTDVDRKDPFTFCIFALERLIMNEGKCTPNGGSASDGSKSVTTTSSKDESKTVGISTIGGMMLLGWIFNRF